MMLVLSRKLNESIQIDSMIEITVISIGKGRVKLGINAPAHVRIIRNELNNIGPELVVEENFPRSQQAST
jgi:carbon storage regulator